jgi:hypothetical protein
MFQAHKDAYECACRVATGSPSSHEIEREYKARRSRADDENLGFAHCDLCRSYRGRNAKRYGSVAIAVG